MTTMTMMRDSGRILGKIFFFCWNLIDLNFFFNFCCAYNTTTTTTTVTTTTTTTEFKNFFLIKKKTEQKFNRCVEVVCVHVSAFFFWYLNDQARFWFGWFQTFSFISFFFLIVNRFNSSTMVGWCVCLVWMLYNNSQKFSFFFTNSFLTKPTKKLWFQQQQQGPCMWCVYRIAAIYIYYLMLQLISLSLFQSIMRPVFFRFHYDDDDDDGKWIESCHLCFVGFHLYMLLLVGCFLLFFLSHTHTNTFIPK